MIKNVSSAIVVSRVNVYSIDGFEDYFYGYMVPNTKYIRYFDLKLYEYGFCTYAAIDAGAYSAAAICPLPKLFPYIGRFLTMGTTSGSGDSRSFK